MKAKFRYKRNVYKRILRGNAKINVEDYIFLTIHNVKAEEKLGGHLEGLFHVVHRTTRSYIIQLGEVVERANSDIDNRYRVNSDLIGWAPAPTVTEAVKISRSMEVNPEGMANSNCSGEDWLVNEVMDHRRSEDDVEFKVDWKGD